MSQMLLVCTANVCRSPLAALWLARALESSGVSVLSAGTHARAGAEMDPHSASIAHRAGVTAEATAAHRARRITAADIHASDLILTMTQAHRSYAAELVPDRISSMFTILEISELLARMSALPADNAPSEPLFRAEFDGPTFARPFTTREHAGESIPVDTRDLNGVIAQLASRLDTERLRSASIAIPQLDIGDPYGGTAEEYATAWGLLEPALTGMATAVRKSLQRNAV